MIKLIVGTKGTGKTKTLIDMARKAAEESKGNVVCVEKGDKLAHELPNAVRLVNSEEYDIRGFANLYGFLAGICAGNYDVTDILVDSTLKITGTGAEVVDLLVNDLKKLEKEGFQVELLPVHENGMVSARQVADAIREDTCLVTVMFANNEIGSILPIEEIGAVCREKGVLFHTDAVQAAGHLPIDVQAQHIDMLSLSGHKFHGPKGVGALYVRGGIPLVNVIEGGAQERGKRAGTENVPGIAGMAAALEDACAHMEENRVKVTALRDRLIQGLSKIPHSAVNGDLEHRLPGNVNLCFEGIEGESLLLLLDAAGICASSGSACTSGSLDPSHVLLAIGRPHEVAHGSLRLSLCEWNTQEEVDHILREVPRVVEYLRSMSPVWKDLESGKKAFML